MEYKNPNKIIKAKYLNNILKITFEDGFINEINWLNLIKAIKYDKYLDIDLSYLTVECKRETYSLVLYSKDRKDKYYFNAGSLRKWK